MSSCEAKLEAFIGRVREVNRSAARYMRTRQTAEKLAVRRRLAELAGCLADELIITRNTTESLDTVISGIDWRPGDEAVMAAQDCGARFRVYTVAIDSAGVRGVRITPHVFTTTGELDVLVRALRTLAA